MNPVTVAQIKLVVALLLDTADFFVGRIPGFGVAFDAVLTAIGFALFGWKGLTQLWEMVDLTEQIDGFVPTLTLMALIELRQAHAKAKRDLAD